MHSRRGVWGSRLEPAGAFAIPRCSTPWPLQSRYRAQCGSNRDFTAFEKLRSALAYFAVISVRVITDNSRSNRFSVPATRAHTHEERPSLRALLLRIVAPLTPGIPRDMLCK